jgi:hypothetical protein
MFENKQVEELFSTSLDYLFNTKVDDLFNYKKPAPITYKRQMWKKYQYTLESEETAINIFDIFGDNSAVALYRFENNANDDGGQYNGTWQGNEQYDVGKFGKAAKFDGDSNDIAKIVTSDQMTLENFTLSFWFNENDTSNHPMPIYFDDANTFIYFYSDDIYYRYNGTDKYIDNNMRPTSNSWHLLTMVVGNDEVKLYLDGSLKQSDSVSTASLTSKLSIGGSYDKIYNFNGLIDQIRIFNRVLTDDEINTLYNEKVNTIKTVTDYKKITLNGLNIKTKILTDYLNNLNDVKFKIAPYLNNPNDVKFRIAPYKNIQNYIFYRIGYDSPPPIRIIVKDLDDN